MTLLAQVEPLTSWASVALQGGAFALLTYIVIRLAPDALRDARAERESRDQRFEGLVRSMQVAFEVRTQLLVTVIEKQTVELTKAMSSVCRQPPRAL